MQLFIDRCKEKEEIIERLSKEYPPPSKLMKEDKEILEEKSKENLLYSFKEELIRVTKIYENKLALRDHRIKTLEFDI